jgi:hypothetical protein
MSLNTWLENIIVEKMVDDKETNNKIADKYEIKRKYIELIYWSGLGLLAFYSIFTLCIYLYCRKTLKNDRYVLSAMLSIFLIIFTIYIGIGAIVGLIRQKYTQNRDIILNKNNSSQETILLVLFSYLSALSAILLFIPLIFIYLMISGNMIIKLYKV